MAIREGQTATNPKTGATVVYKGGQWVSAGATPGGPAAPPLVNPDRTTLNTLNNQAAEGTEVKKQYDAAAQAIKAFSPGPLKGMMYDMLTPEDNGGVMDKIGGVIGAPLRAIGAMPQSQIDAFQKLKGLQANRVLSEQLLQKGRQTDSDAARMMLTEVSPYKSPDTNAGVIQRGTARVDRAIGRAPFYANWAHKYGLNGVDEHGQAVEQAFAAQSGGGAPKRLKFDPKTGKIQ